MKRVQDAADPRRCKGAFAHEQCWNEAEHGSELCAAHGGKSTAAREEKRMYLLHDVQTRERTAAFTDNDQAKSLKEEIGLIRTMIERHQNLIKSDNDLLQRTACVSNLVLTLEKLLKTSHAIEQDLDIMLSKQAVLRVAQRIIQIVAEELEGIEGYEQIIDRIHGRMTGVVASETNKATQPLLTA